MEADARLCGGRYEDKKELPQPSRCEWVWGRVVGLSVEKIYVHLEHSSCPININNYGVPV